MSEVEIEGLDALVEAFRGAPDLIDEQQHDTLAGIGILVRDQAVAETQRRGLARPGDSGRGTGALSGGIMENVEGDSVFVRDAVTNPKDRFPYPAMYEFSRHRPFLEPALQASEDEIYARFETAVDDLITEIDD